jgi:hypothetical protein
MSLSAWSSDGKSRRSVIKTPPLRVAGQSLDERISELQDEYGDLLILPFCLIVLALFEWWHWMTAVPPSPWILTTAAILSVIYAFKKGYPIIAMIRNLRFGRDGERSVGQMLERFREKGYQIFHDVPAAGFNIDHAIVGPAGIFTIETKMRSKPVSSAKVLYDGNTIRIGETPAHNESLVQARAQARWLAELLNDGRKRPIFTVRPVVVFPDWYVEWTSRLRRNDVWVLNPKALDRFIENEPVALSSDLIESASHTLTRYYRGASQAS